MAFILRIVLNAVGLLVIDYLMDSVTVDSFGAAVVAVIILSIVNTLIRPILLLLALPITFLTLGLFALVINGAMFYLVATLVDGFHVSSFFGVVIGAIFMSIVYSLTAIKD